MSFRHVGVTILVAIAIAGLSATALLFGWLDRTVLEPESFEAAVVDAMQRPEAQTAVAGAVVDIGVEAVPLLELVRDPVESLVATALGTPILEEVYRGIARAMHNRLATGESDPVVAALTAVEGTILEPLAAVAPQVIGLLPEGIFDSIEIVGEGGLPALTFADRHADIVAFLSAAVAFLLVVGSAVWNPRHDVGLLAGGAGVALGGAAVIGWIPLGRAATERLVTGDLATTITLEIYSVLAESLLVAAWWTVGLGLLLVAAGGVWVVFGQAHRRQIA